MISIIIPFYNKHSYINDCIDSLKNQISDDDEILIIDDGSDVSLINNFDIKNLRIVRKSNGGVSSARNFGIKLAKNNYIFFLDSDDFIVESSIERIKYHINNNSNFHIFAFNYFRFRNNKYIKNDKFSSGIIDLLDCLRKYKFPFNSSSLIIKKEFLLKNNIFFNEHLKYAEDQLFWIVCSLNEQIYYFNEYLSVYRYDTETSTSVILRKDVKLNTLFLNELFMLYLKFENNKLLDIIDQQIFQTCKLLFLNRDFNKLELYSQLIRNIKYRFIIQVFIFCKYFIKNL